MYVWLLFEIMCESSSMVNDLEGDFDDTYYELRENVRRKKAKKNYESLRDETHHHQKKRVKKVNKKRGRKIIITKDVFHYHFISNYLIIKYRYHYPLLLVFLLCNILSCFSFNIVRKSFNNAASFC